MNSKFRKFDGYRIPNVVKYITDYLLQKPEVELIIGTDSQNKGQFTVYCTVIALYTPGKGAHCIYRKWKTRRVAVRSTRLISEVYASIEIANMLRYSGLRISYIDIDINPDPKFKSFEVFPSAKGMVEGMGFECRYKTLTPLITSMADWVVKS